MTSLETYLRDIRGTGRKVLVPYIVAGQTDDWLDCVSAAVFAGADLVEVGIPFSDPMMDGVVIQKASDAALSRGATLESILEQLSHYEATVPLVAMTYFNIFHHFGIEKASSEMSGVGIRGCIVPDLPLEAGGEWREALNAHDIASILMVAPSTPPDRAAMIAATSQGFAYAQARMAVTGAASDEGDSASVVKRIRRGSDIPAFIGVGISSAESARQAATHADGVIVGSALVQRILNGEGPSGVESFVGELRRAIDSLG